MGVRVTERRYADLCHDFHVYIGLVAGAAGAAQEFGAALGANC